MQEYNNYNQEILDYLGIKKSEEKYDKTEIDIEKTAKYLSKGYDVLITIDNNLLIKKPQTKILTIKENDNIKNIYIIDENNFDKLKEYIQSKTHEELKIASSDIEVNEESVLDDTETAKLINNIILNAIKRNVSDIHILPKEKETVIKFRENGELVVFKKLPKSYCQYIVNKLKTLSKNMDIANNLEPQDGKVSLTINDKNIELRISTVPTIHGEDAVLRVQQTDNLFKLTLEDTGYFPEDLEVYRRNFNKPYGMILNVGATGSGKTTTFYLTIKELVEKFKGKKNIVTAEDPVEIKFDEITQIEVDDRQGRSFAKVLRALMRHDPDIILIGEIRDEETAHIAVKASLTGHLVLATLHANDTFNAISRLRDLGLSDSLISATTNCIVSQRLVKKLCPHCKRKRKVTVKEKQDYELDFDEVYEAVGCEKCNNTGYIGRTAVSEVLELNEDMKRAITNSLPEVEIKKLAREIRFRNLWVNAMRKVKDGITSLEEAILMVNKDPIINNKKAANQAHVDTKVILYPDKKIPVIMNQNEGYLFDVSKSGLSIIFENAYLPDVNQEFNIKVDKKEIMFLPKSYARYGNKFIVGGLYNGDLSEYLD